MPHENNFQHDELSRKSPGERLATAELTSGVQPESPAWFDATAQCGTTLAQAGVRAIVLLHGSIHGTDVFGMQRLDEAGGLKRGYSRGVSGVDALLTAMREGGNGIPSLPGGLTLPLANDEATKKIIDEQVGDAGNFTDAAVGSFQKTINKSLAKPIACIRYLWSSEHHHLGRAMAAVRLLAELRTICDSQSLGKGDRIMVEAHGQGGLVLALASKTDPTAFVRVMILPRELKGRPLMHAVAPSARAPSRNDIGTRRSSSSVVRAMIGIIMMPSARPPASAVNVLNGSTAVA